MLYLHYAALICMSTPKRDAWRNDVEERSILDTHMSLSIAGEIHSFSFFCRCFDVCLTSCLLTCPRAYAMHMSLSH